DAERSFFRVGNVMGRFLLPLSPPFVISVCNDQTPATFQCGSKHGFFRDGLSPRVDALGGELDVLGPRRHQPPAKRCRLPPSAVWSGPQGEDQLRRSDVESRREFGEGGPKIVEQSLRRSPQGKATTHKLILIVEHK